MLNWTLFKAFWSKKTKAYSDFSCREYFINKYHLIASLFDEAPVRDAVFAQIRNAIRLTDATTDEKVRSTIASVALASAVMAGLPGRLGVGVPVKSAGCHEYLRLGLLSNTKPSLADGESWSNRNAPSPNPDRGVGGLYHASAGWGRLARRGWRFSRISKGSSWISRTAAPAR